MGAHGVILEISKLTPGSSEGLEVRGQQVQSLTGAWSLSLHLTAACVGRKTVSIAQSAVLPVFTLPRAWVTQAGQTAAHHA
jgi:hypothetical protein